MKIFLSRKTLDNLDLSQRKNLIPGSYRKYYDLESGKEIYRLLTYLSFQFNKEIFIDLGTSLGSSAISLSSNINNFIYSFDIRERYFHVAAQNNNRISNNEIFWFDNVDFIITKNFLTYGSLILKSKIIYLDIDHGGQNEKIVIDFLIYHKWNGILIMDDINYFEELKLLYDNINIKKYDLTYLGHWSGTGLINFSNDIELILE